MDNRPIGVFDSGVGGLSVVKELRKIMPNEDILYLGDTGRAPYGTRSRQTIRSYAAQSIRFLLGKEVKAIVAACGTISSNVSDKDVAALGVTVPYTGVVLPATRWACALGGSSRIGVIATTASIRSGAYGKAARSILPSARILGQACPLFVPLVENGMFDKDNQIAKLTAQLYVKPLIEENIDTLILGCTHFPLLYDILSDVLQYKVTLIDPGAAAAAHIKALLCEEGILSQGEQSGTTRYYVTDTVEGFAEVAQYFIGEDVSKNTITVDLSSIGV